MKPARFDYVRAATLAEAHATLNGGGDDARIVAGGQSLVPMLSMRLARPAVLVDIMHLPELAKIEVKDGAIRVGA
ncbi:MAG TPA: FAD binding domain-containing protein, partial [Pseudolabrys sp.]|nr:FAD binding domain-containing protein [Pseudolabrys sp.]